MGALWSITADVLVLAVLALGACGLMLVEKYATKWWRQWRDR